MFKNKFCNQLNFKKNNNVKRLKLLFNNTDYTIVEILEYINEGKIFINTYRKFFGGTQFIFRNNKVKNYNNCYKLVNQIKMDKNKYYKCKKSKSNKEKLQNLCAFNVGVKNNGSIDKVFRNNNSNNEFLTSIYPGNFNTYPNITNNELFDKKNTISLINSMNDFN